MEQLKSQLIICYDPGTSVSKILYQIGNQSVKHLTMESEIITLSAASINNLPTSCLFGKPEDNAWVRFRKEAPECYAVGRLAKEYRATVSLKRLKYESLIPKIMTAIGAIAMKENLDSKFDVDLAVLIPFGEYANRFELETELKSVLKSFYFQNQRYQLNLNEYRCYPEGFGMALSSIRHCSIEQFQGQTSIYLMLGYRNTSMLLFREGTLSGRESSTTQLGFYDLIDKITAKVSGLVREEVQSAIVTVEKGFHNKAKAKREYQNVTKIVVEDLVKSSQNKLVEKEKEVIELAVKTASTEYEQLST